MAIKCRRELLGGLYTGINCQEITKTSKMVHIGVSLSCSFSVFLSLLYFSGSLDLFVQNSVIVIGARAEWT